MEHAHTQTHTHNHNKKRQELIKQRHCRGAIPGYKSGRQENNHNVDRNFRMNNISHLFVQRSTYDGNVTLTGADIPQENNATISNIPSSQDIMSQRAFLSAFVALLAIFFVIGSFVIFLPGGRNTRRRISTLTRNMTISREKFQARCSQIEQMLINRRIVAILPLDGEGDLNLLNSSSNNTEKVCIKMSYPIETTEKIDICRQNSENDELEEGDIELRVVPPENYPVHSEEAVECSSQSDEYTLLERQEQESAEQHISEATTCAMCLTEYVVGDEVCFSSNPDCIHVFHKDCIVEWLARSPNCPCCKRPYIEIEDYDDYSDDGEEDDDASNDDDDDEDFEAA